MTLVHLAMAFVLGNPAVTSAIIGPRTMEQLDQPARRAPTSSSTDDVLDRIDEIVPPGTNFNWADAGYTPADGRRRRGPAAAGRAPGAKSDLVRSGFGVVGSATVVTRPSM